MAQMKTYRVGPELPPCELDPPAFDDIYPVEGRYMGRCNCREWKMHDKIIPRELVRLSQRCHLCRAGIEFSRDSGW